jgi:hypothetical protein
MRSRVTVATSAHLTARSRRRLPSTNPLVSAFSGIGAILFLAGLSG